MSQSVGEVLIESPAPPGIQIKGREIGQRWVGFLLVIFDWALIWDGKYQIRSGRKTEDRSSLPCSSSSLTQLHPLLTKLTISRYSGERQGLSSGSSRLGDLRGYFRFLILTGRNTILQQQHHHCRLVEILPNILCGVRWFSQESILSRIVNVVNILVKTWRDISI